MIHIVTADGRAEFAALDGLAGRGGAPGADVEAAVREILEAVRTDGDAAVLRYTEKFDGPEAVRGGIAVLTREDLKTALESLPDALASALLHAADNIRKYHAKQVSEGYEERRTDGTVIGQIVRGLTRVGLYVPGGTAAYPSTVLMNAIPAKLAGVGELVMVTPPRGGAGTDAAILGAAYLAGVDKVILAGGAQAVAALAYGTETFPRVDKIVGPGNIYVATAKRLLFGLIDIEMIAGPSEILVVADGEAQSGGDPTFIAADLLSQAEHDPDAAAILLTTSAQLAEDVVREIEQQLGNLSRTDIARKSIDANGLVIVCRSDDEMADLANLAAPEHLELLVRDPLGWLPRIRNAGSVFCGPWTPEPVGDYYAGTNHVLPTSGTARFASPLGVYDFVKRMSYTQYTREALAAAKDDILAIGEAEGLTAHTQAVRVRFVE
ncbi:MAG: histidinol dehydrogenase [Clostridiales Family XIII bacterium]|jgi:histidinol dehydrogenase|nr:histidinol dehydrogenase [Clostridiales Family XIII bacterium]